MINFYNCNISKVKVILKKYEYQIVKNIKKHLLLKILKTATVIDSFTYVLPEERLNQWT